MGSLHTNIRFRTILLAVLLCEAGVLLAQMRSQSASLSATLFLPRLHYEPWWTVEPSEIDMGATIPANTNVIIHLPLNMANMDREALLGNRGKNVRYWGYCFPNDYDPNSLPQDVGFPGRMFLSEAEQAARENKPSQQIPQYSIYQPPTRQQIMRDQWTREQHGDIRQQIEIFQGGQNCYIMTEAPLPIGTDRDDDGLNSQLEKQFGTDPLKADTDMDGATDGVEIFNLHTDPLNPDTDGDGVPDGIEVHGHSQVQAGDTDPLQADSDHDGLCDGLCMLDRNRRFCTSDAVMRCTNDNMQLTRSIRPFAGEDKNLNGKVDAGETDPLKWSTADDGISDEQKYWNCLLQKKKDC